jgi:Fe2+ or Zn2+ uptake regulation protein
MDHDHQDETYSQGFKQFAIKTLRERGSRVTKPRLAVIECFDRSDEPLNAKEVMSWLQRHPDAGGLDIDNVTAYRILEKFHEFSLLHQIAPTGRYIACTHFKCLETHHVLLHCQKCQQVNEEHVPSELLASFFWYLENTLNFYPKKHVFQLDGLCQKCRNKSIKQ